MRTPEQARWGLAEVGNLCISSFALLIIFYILYIDRALIRQMIKNVGPFNSLRALLRVAKDQVDP